MPTPESRYQGRRCDVVDRNGNRCDLPMGHVDRGRSEWHETSVDDQPRAWTTA